VGRFVDLARGLWNALRSRRLDHEMEEEVAFHLEARERDLVARGMPPAEAARRARVEFGGLGAAKERHRDARGVPRLEHLVRDVVLAWRSLRRSPALVATCVLSLAIGIGVNTTLFAALHAVLFYEPTAADADRLLWLESGSSNQWSYLNLRDLRERQVFADVFGYRQVRMAMRSGGGVLPIEGLAVTANFFDGLGVRAAMGHTFTWESTPAETEPRVVVLSHALWMRQFGSDQGILGRVLVLNGQPFDIVGVLPADYRPVLSLASPDFYVPLSSHTYSNLKTRNNGNALDVIARLRPGVSIEQARSAVGTVDADLERAFPRDNDGMGERPPSLVPFAGVGAMAARRPEAILAPAVVAALFGLVLIIACANVAGLLMARAAARRQELAMRAALGADRWRLVQALLVESVLLCIMGDAAATLSTIALLPSLRTFSLPGVASLTLDVRAGGALFGFATALALTAGLLSGIVPALRATRSDLLTDIRQGSGHGTTARLRSRQVFVVAQVTGSIVLLIVASLFVRSLMHVAEIDPGFDLDGGLVARIDLDVARARPEARAIFAQQIVDGLSRLPAVRSVAVADIVPLGTDASRRTIRAESNGEILSVPTYLNSVGPRYFETMGIGIVRGRGFTLADRIGAPGVVVVSQAFVRQVFPDGNAIGREIELGRGDRFQVVGIVHDTMYRWFGETPQPLLYFAYAQRPVSSQLRPLTVHVRANVSQAMTRAIADTVAQIDRNVIVDVRTLREAAGTETTLRRAASVILASLGVVGLLLSAIGLYGVISFVIESRTTEIGVRMALGASAGRVRTDVLRYAMKLVGLGVAVGAAIAILVTRMLSSLLAGLSPADPMAFGIPAAILVAIGALAGDLPARRATRVDPTIALRQQ
jgi:predicted permease